MKNLIITLIALIPALAAIFIVSVTITFVAIVMLPMTIYGHLQMADINKGK